MNWSSAGPGEVPGGISADHLAQRPTVHGPGFPATPLSLEQARRLVSGYVERYNTVRLHSASGYVSGPATIAAA